MLYLEYIEYKMYLLKQSHFFELYLTFDQSCSCLSLSVNGSPARVRELRRTADLKLAKADFLLDKIPPKLGFDPVDLGVTAAEGTPPPPPVSVSASYSLSAEDFALSIAAL